MSKAFHFCTVIKTEVMSENGNFLMFFIVKQVQQSCRICDSYKVKLKLVDDRPTDGPTDRRTLQHIDLLSQIKIV